MEFLQDNRIKIDPPKKPKKLTATRFATILGLNAWQTPFSAWCEITRTYEEPFIDTKYTAAGKIIESKICDYLRNRYFMEIQSPTDVYGPDYFRKTWGDFFPNETVLGGMWDFLGDDFVVEVKTTKRVEDWKGVNGEVEPPIYYKLQAALYAYLLGFDNVVMTCTFLTDNDYPIETAPGKFDTAPTEKFTPNADNTVVIEFKVSEAFPTFKETYIDPALKFWKDHVITGISPEWDDKRDADILTALRKNEIEISDRDIIKMIAEADKLKKSIDLAASKVKDKSDRLKELDKKIKSYMASQFRDGDTKVELTGKLNIWTLSKSTSQSLDEAAVINKLHDLNVSDDDISKLYKSSVKTTLRKKSIEEDK